MWELRENPIYNYLYFNKLQALFFVIYIYIRYINVL